MTKTYKITIADTPDIVVLSPEIVALLIKKVRCSDTKEFVIPAKELLPRDYAQYLIRVLAANTEAAPSGIGIRKVYSLAAGQMRTLSVNRLHCFDNVELCGQRASTCFRLSVNEAFYELAELPLQYMDVICVPMNMSM